MAENKIQEERNPFSSGLDFSEEEYVKNAPIEDFLSGTVTTNPDDIEKIDEEKEKKEKEKKEKERLDQKKLKEEAQKKTDEVIDTFLGEEEEEEEEEEQKPLKTKKKETLEKKETEEEEEESDDDSEKEKSNNTFSIISKTLFEQGIFSEKEEDKENPIDSAEKLLERFNVEKQIGANQLFENFVGQFGDDYKNAFYSIFVDGVDPKEYFTTYNEIVDLANLDLKVESNQELIVKQELQERGYNPEQIKIKIERFKNNGELEDEATHSHSVLLKAQTTRLAQKQEAAQAAQKQQTAIEQQFAHNVTKTLEDKLKTKEFDGIPLNPNLAKELQDYLITKKYTIKSTGEKLTDFDVAILELKKPENHAMKVKIALLLKTLEKDPTLQTIQKAGVTKQSNSLFGELVTKKDKSSVKVPKGSPFANI